MCQLLGVTCRSPVYMNGAMKKYVASKVNTRVEEETSACGLSIQFRTVGTSKVQEIQSDVGRSLSQLVGSDNITDMFLCLPLCERINERTEDEPAIGAEPLCLTFTKAVRYQGTSRSCRHRHNNADPIHQPVARCRISQQVLPQWRLNGAPFETAYPKQTKNRVGRTRATGSGFDGRIGKGSFPSSSIEVDMVVRPSRRRVWGDSDRITG